MRALSVRSAHDVHIRIDHVTHKCMYIKHLRHFDGSFIPVVLREDGQEANAQEKAVNLQRQKAACPPPPPTAPPQDEAVASTAPTQDEAAPHRDKKVHLHLHHPHLHPKTKLHLKNSKDQGLPVPALHKPSQAKISLQLYFNLHILGSSSREAQKAQGKKKEFKLRSVDDEEIVIA